MKKILFLFFCLCLLLSCNKDNIQNVSTTVNLKNIDSQSVYVNDGYLEDGTVYSNCILMLCTDSISIDDSGIVSGSGKIFRLYVGAYLDLTDDSVIVMSNMEKTLNNINGGKQCKINYCEVFDVNNGSESFDNSDYDIKLIRQNDKGVYSLTLSKTRYGNNPKDLYAYVFNGYIRLMDMRTSRSMYSLETETISNYVIGSTGIADVNLMPKQTRTDTLNCNKYQFFVHDDYDKTNDYAFVVNCYGDSLIGKFNVSDSLYNWSIEPSEGYDVFNPEFNNVFGIWNRHNQKFIRDFHFITGGYLEIGYDKDSTLVMNGNLVTYFGSTINVVETKVINHSN